MRISFISSLLIYREHYLNVKAVEINISECEIWGEGKTEADLVHITVI